MGTLDSAGLTYPAMKAAFILALLLIELSLLETFGLKHENKNCPVSLWSGPNMCTIFKNVNTREGCQRNCNAGYEELKTKVIVAKKLEKEFRRFLNFDPYKNLIMWNPQGNPAKRCKCVYSVWFHVGYGK